MSEVLPVRRWGVHRWVGDDLIADAGEDAVLAEARVVLLREVERRRMVAVDVPRAQLVDPRELFIDATFTTDDGDEIPLYWEGGRFAVAWVRCVTPGGETP